MSEKEVKHRWLAITKCRFNIPKDLDYKDYSIAMMITVTEPSYPDNDDGTKDAVYKAKASGELIIKDEFDKVYIKSDRRSKSQLFRGQVVQDLDIPDNYTPTDWYNWFMDKLRHYYPEVKAYIKKLEEEK